MKFQPELYQSYASLYEFAIDMNVIVGSKRILEYEGENWVHTFVYDNEQDMISYTSTDKIFTLKNKYARLKPDELSNFNLPTIDITKEAILGVLVHESKKFCYQVVGYDKIRKLSQDISLENMVMRTNITHVNACENCGSTPENNKLFKCSRCVTTRYCSKECQRAHWKFHKRQCVH
jgi:hypothetical protein